MKQLSEVFGDKKVLITGGLGFLGSNLARRLVELSAHVSVVDSLVPDQGGNRFNIEGIEDRLEVQVADIKDTEVVSRLVRGCDYVFNLAARTSHVRSIEQPLEDLEANCRSQLLFLELLKATNRDCRVIYTGSRSQYGRALYLPVDEEHPFNAMDTNGVHKATVEMYHLLYSRVFGIRCTCLRLSNVYGPRHQMSHSRQGFIHWFIRLALSSQNIEVFGDGTHQRDFIFVDDAIEAMLQAAAEPSCYGEALNVGTGIPLTIGEIASRIAARTGCTYDLVPFPEDFLNVEIGDLYLDVSRIMRMTGWAPEVGFDDGLDTTLDFYRRHGDKYWNDADANMIR
jgi:UDP-glucose 4-epimerase